MCNSMVSFSAEDKWRILVLGLQHISRPITRDIASEEIERDLGSLDSSLKDMYYL